MQNNKINIYIKNNIWAKYKHSILKLYLSKILKNHVELQSRITMFLGVQSNQTQIWSAYWNKKEICLFTNAKSKNWVTMQTKLYEG